MANLGTIPATVNEALAKPRASHKCYSDMMVRSLSACTADEMAVIKQPPLTPLTVDRYASHNYNKVLSRTIAPFKSLEFQAYVRIIYENGIANSISV